MDSEQRLFHFAGYTLDLDRGLLSGAAGTINLRAKSFDLLAYMVRNADRVLSKDELIASVWNRIVVSDDSLTQCIRDIRRVLGDSEQKLVRTVPRRGYLFCTTAPSAAVTAPDTAAGPSPAARPRIVVLPFGNLSSDPEQEFFADGITEDIITDLSKVSGLQVIARNSAFTYKGRPTRIKDVATDLDVRYVLEGSVRRVGSRVRINGQLIDAASDTPIWAERFDRDLVDIFAIQDEITLAIVEQLKVRLLPAEQHEIARPRTGDLEAYDYYLKGRRFAHEWTKSYTILAKRMFLKAIEHDPTYARAYAGVASADAALYGWHSAEASLDDMLEMSGKALALDAGLAEAHATRGLALHRHERPAEARAEFETALSLDPDLYEAHFYYGRLEFMEGNLAAALALFVRAAALRSDDYVSPVHIMTCCHALGQEAERRRWAGICVERAERALASHPENAGPLHRGALALAHLGDAERATAWIDRALALDPDDRVALYNRVCILSLLGQIEPALDGLETLLSFSSAEQMDWFVNDSDLDPIRHHPRFRTLFG